MTKLPAQVFDELRDIVGAAHISQDDSVVASHNWNYMSPEQASVQNLLSVPPSAVILPGSTEEVAAVVKACVKHGIQYKAHSTGYGSYSCVSTAGAISIDLRRMNRLEIDAENQMAIIEPYVTAGQLLAEAMKVGLFCHIIGAGPLHSPLASAAAYCGVGLPGNHTSNNARNLLSLEWVTPAGEIVRIGSAGSGVGWFTGEGPGPGFRGLIRGLLGTQGGLGVFTKIGYKLHPWPGQRKLELTGSNPQFGMRLPHHFKFHQVRWNDWEGVMAATFDFNQSGIATLLVRMPPDCIGVILTRTNREFYDLYESGTLPPAAKSDTGMGWSVLLTSFSEEELAYKEEVFKSILSKTGGQEVPLSKEHEEQLALTLTTSLYVARGFRRGGGVITSFGVLDSFALLPRVIKSSEKLMQDSLAKGDILNTHPEQNWIWPSEGRHLWTENAPVGDKWDKDGIASNLLYILESFYDQQQTGAGIAGFVSAGAADMFGPKMGRVNEWMRKTKLLFDPRNLSNSKSYIEPTKDSIAKIWPVAQKFVFRPPFRALFRNAVKRTIK